MGKKHRKRPVIISEHPGAVAVPVNGELRCPRCKHGVIDGDGPYRCQKCGDVFVAELVETKSEYYFLLIPGRGTDDPVLGSIEREYGGNAGSAPSETARATY